MEVTAPCSAADAPAWRSCEGGKGGEVQTPVSFHSEDPCKNVGFWPEQGESEEDQKAEKEETSSTSFLIPKILGIAREVSADEGVQNSHRDKATVPDIADPGVWHCVGTTQANAQAVRHMVSWGLQLPVPAHLHRTDKKQAGEQWPVMGPADLQGDESTRQCNIKHLLAQYVLR